MARNYKKEYNSYHSTDAQKKRRAGRNKARRLMTREKGESAMKGKDVDHRDRNPNNNSRANLRISTRRINRGRNK